MKIFPVLSLGFILSRAALAAPPAAVPSVEPHFFRPASCKEVVGALMHCDFVSQSVAYHISETGWVDVNTQKNVFALGNPNDKAFVGQVFFATHGNLLFLYYTLVQADQDARLDVWDMTRIQRVWREDNPPPVSCSLREGMSVYFGGKGRFVKMDLSSGRKEWLQSLSTLSGSPLCESGCEIERKKETLRIYDTAVSDSVLLDAEDGRVLNVEKGGE